MEIYSEQDKRIYIVIKDIDEDDHDYMGALDKWEQILTKTLKFPLDARVEDSDDGCPHTDRDKLKVRIE